MSRDSQVSFQTCLTTTECPSTTSATLTSFMEKMFQKRSTLEFLKTWKNSTKRSYQNN